MSLRWIPSHLAAMVVLLTIANASFAADLEAARANLEAQFASLDSNGDDNLDEDELDQLPAGQLQALHNHGLPAMYPLPREVFIAAGMAAASAIMQDDSPTEETRKAEAVLKAVDVAVKAVDAKVMSIDPKSKSGQTRSSNKKSHYVPELPSEFSTRDKNGDGQIALYEWDRKKYAEFAKLDKNGDGFLTPAELLPKGALKNLYTRTPEPPKADGGKDGGKDGGRGRDGGRDGNREGEDQVVREAAMIFGHLDENKDGMIDETEWGKSRQTKGSLEQAGVTVSLPFNTDALAGYLRRAKEATGR